MITTRSIPVDELTVDPLQSREKAWVGDAADQRLAAAIAAEGLRQDIIVRPIDAIGNGEPASPADDPDDRAVPSAPTPPTDDTSTSAKNGAAETAAPTASGRTAVTTDATVPDETDGTAPTVPTDTPDTAATTDTADAPDTIDTTDSTDTPDTPDTTGTADTADTSDPTDTIETTGTTEATETTETTEATYAIVAGSRRYHAAMEAGLETVRCKVIEAGDLEAAWTSLTENTARKDLSEQEIARQLAVIYELVRPREPPTACPECGTQVDGEDALYAHCEQTDCSVPLRPATTGRATSSSPADTARSDATPTDYRAPPAGRFLTDRQAKAYLAERFLGRTDASARQLIAGHLRTAQLPAELQALFKDADDRTAAERTALENFGIDPATTLGSGEGKSGTSREIVALHETFAETAADAVDPTTGVLEAVGTLRFDGMSEQELRRTLRDFRHDLTAALDGGDTDSDSDTDTDTDTDTDADSGEIDRQTITETLETHRRSLRETHEELATDRPFKKVDVLGPDTQRHSRWHARVFQRRDIDGHGELVRALYLERLAAIADEEGWS